MTNDAVYVLRGLEELYPEDQFIADLRHLIEHHEINFQDMMSRGQVRSKQWILHTLKHIGFDKLGRVVTVAGWYGMLARMILDSDIIHAHHVELHDIDPHAVSMSLAFNERYKLDESYDAIQCDSYSTLLSRFDTVINTSVEHFEKPDQWWQMVPPGRLVIVQSNDFADIHDHLSCVDSEDELAEMLPMEKVHFKGALPTYKYTRFMVIGTK